MRISLKRKVGIKKIDRLIAALKLALSRVR
jgi:hypothetical protein